MWKWELRPPTSSHALYKVLDILEDGVRCSYEELKIDNIFTSMFLREVRLSLEATIMAGEEEKVVVTFLLLGA